MRESKLMQRALRSASVPALLHRIEAGRTRVEVRFDGDAVWLSLGQMAQLYDVEVPTINYYLKMVFEDSELEEDAAIQSFRITAADGKTYDTKHYNCVFRPIVITKIGIVIARIGSS
jgi:hypothetical protein